jgi:hypothetical protein
VTISVDASSTSGTTASSGSITLNKPSNAAVGDTMIAVVRNTGSMTTPTGWGLMSSTLASNKFSAYQKTVLAGEPSNYTFSGNGGNISFQGAIALVKGAASGFAVNAPGGPSYDTAAANDNTSSANIVAPTITPIKMAGELLIAFYFADAANAITVPGGQTSAAALNTNSRAVCIGWEVLSTMAASGTRTATMGSAATNQAVSLLVYPPFAAIGTGAVLGAPATAASGWASRAYNNGYGQSALNGPARPFPFWLYDSGVGPTTNSQMVSTNLAQAGSTPMSVLGGWCNTDVLGTLSGTFKINTVPVYRGLVMLGYRPSGQIIKTTRTAADGSFSFSGLDRTVTVDNGYFAIAIDPNGLGTQYDSQILDRLIPG